MERPKKTRTKEQERHKMAIRVGGGVGGVFVWGGALAIATLVSVSAIKLRNRRSNTKTLPPPPPPPPPPPVVSTDLQSNKLELNNNKDEGSEGLRALLQHPSPPMHHHTSSDGATNMGMIQIDSTSLILPESLILNNNSQNENSTNGDQKIIFSDDPKPETRGLAIDDDVQVEEFYLPISESLSFLKPDKVNEYTEDLLVSEVIEVANDEKAIEAPNADQIEVEDSPQMQSVGGEEEYGDGKNIVEKCVKVETAIAIEDDPQAQLNQKEKEDNEEHKEEEEEVIVEKRVTVETAQADQIAVDDNPKGQLSEEEEEENSEEDVVEKVVTVETARADQIAVEEDPQAQLIEEEEEDNEKGILEKGVTVETAPEDQIAVEEDPQAQLSEEEEDEEEEEEYNFDDDNDEEEEDIVGRGEESSEGTGDSSMESNAEAIWPAESMQELSEEFEELKIDNQKLGDEIEEDTTEDGCLNKNEMSNINYDDDSEERVKSTTASINQRDHQSEVLRLMINQPTKSSNLSIWIWSMLVLLLLLVVPLLLSLTQIPHV